jgi:hypothetical protein
MNNIMTIIVDEVMVALDCIETTAGTENFNHINVEKMV